MAKTKANEREFQGQVIAWIKERISQGGLPFENATQDSGLYGMEKVKFPDVLLTLDFECRRPFCGWELKTPTTNVRGTILLNKAVKKAQTLEAKYFVTWNMQTAIIWRTPEKTRITVQEGDKVREFGPDTRITDVNDIRNKDKAEILQITCNRLLLDLAKLHEDEKINLPATDTTIFVGLVGNAAEKIAGTIAGDLKKARGNRAFDKRLAAWAAKQGVNKYDQEYWETLSQQIAYKIIAKVLFYLTLRKQNVNLPKLEFGGDNWRSAMKRMRQLFELALEVDYQAIFEKDITDEVELSEDTAKLIIDLTGNLSHWSFELMQLDVIGHVFEKLVPEEARHTLGQYFTPDNLVDLITSFCIHSENDFIMDPTCGTGTFLIRGYNRLRHLGAKREAHHELLSRIWGFDIAGFPAELATINLYRQDLTDYLNFPRVLSRDFFEVMPGEEFEFPPPKKTFKTGERIKVTIPKFDALVGNFPFIRQELIEKTNKGYKKKLEEVLFDSWAKEYPHLFADKVSGAKQKAQHNLQLSGQADIYAYMFFHAAAHLKAGGRMGFITSNSWLDVAYGYELQRFFLNKFKVIGIFESRCEPWFEQSAVNTVFTILERCENKEEKQNNFVRFVKVKKPLRDLFPHDALMDSQTRWNRLDAFVERMEELPEKWNAGIKDGFKKFDPIRAKYVQEPEFISYEDEDVRVRLIRQENLRTQVEDTKETLKWGKYLHGPDIYFEILEKCADKLVPLDKVAKLKRGITTGINEFFYLTDEQIKHWGIEKEYLKPIVTSTREVPSILVDEKFLEKKVFVCDQSPSKLRGTKALKYIQHGERQTTTDKTRWPDTPSVQGRALWYSLPQNEVSDFLVLRFIDKRHYSPINPNNILVGDTLFVGEFFDRSKTALGYAFLNSILSSLFAEINGRINLGDGLLTTYGPEIGMLLVGLRDENNYSSEDVKMVLELFDKLHERNIMAFDDEIKMADRREFEKQVLKMLGLKDIYEDVALAVNELINERHLLPELRGAKKKKRKEQDIGKLKEEVTEEILSSGVVRFPEGFVKGNVSYREISVAAENIKLGAKGIMVQEIVDSDGRHLMEVGSIEEGKFIVYAKKKDEFVVKVPDSNIVIKKAIHDYELYVREIKDKLYKALMEKSGDHNLSDNIAKQVCEEHGLPDVR
ncbi:MAG: N-6 DNA methylase [Sedimentisphaerales bacterium]